MARGGGSSGGARPGKRPARPGRARGVPARGAAKPAAKGGRATAPAPRDLAPRTFTLGAVPGTSPGVWIGRFRERHPAVQLVLLGVAASDQRRALVDGAVDAALVRLPCADDALHVIPLYDENTVAVVGADSHLAAADELDVTDLAGEIVLVPADDVIGAHIDGAVAASFAPPTDTAEAIATVAAGVGVVIVPFSLARLHARRDVEVRPLRGAPVSGIGIAWRRDEPAADVEAFVGIVRGRTANSSR